VSNIEIYQCIQILKNTIYIKQKGPFKLQKHPFIKNLHTIQFSFLFNMNGKKNKEAAGPNF